MAGIPILADVIAPNNLFSADVRGKQMRRNQRAQNQGGRMQINVGWTNTLRQFSVGTVPLSVDRWQALEGLYEATDAGASGFLMFDPKDCSASIDTGRAIAADSSDPTYQLIKRYTSVGSTRSKDRTITRPKLAGFVLYVLGVPEPTYTLDVETGVITIPSDPAFGDISWSAPFYTPVHFEDDNIDWTLLIAGPADTRMMSGPNVLVTEVRE